MQSMMNICGKGMKIDGTLVRIARLDGDKYIFSDDPKRLLDGLRNCGTRIDLFTFLQKLPETAPKYSYPMEWDNLAVLPITTFDDWWTQQIGFKARNKAKQADKRGVELREAPFDDALIRGIWKIYNECPVRQGRRFPHYGMGLETAHTYAGTFLDQSIFLGAFLNGELIGFAKLTCDETRTQAGLMHIVSMIRHRDKAPTNALIAQAVRSCADRGIRYLVYSNFGYGNKRRDSLSDFKERNGFRRIDLPRYYVPLTRIGRAVFHLGLHHHRLVDYLPEPAIAKLRELRTAWYARKLRTSPEAY